MTHTDADFDVAGIQRRTIRVLLSTQILGGIGVAVGIAVGALLLDDLTGGPSLSGIGSAASVVGGALLAIPIVRVTNARGRRDGLLLAYSVGVIGALVIVAAIYMRSIPLAYLGMLCFGGGTAANLQARYAAVDLAVPQRRGRQLSIVVWATTLGSVCGPSLAPVVDQALQLLNGPHYAGPFLASAIGFAVAAVVIWTFLRPDPYNIARKLRDIDNQRSVSLVAGWHVVRHNPYARLGVASVAVGHLVMVGVMTMTPVHIKHGMHDADSVTTVVGIVLSAHIAGMYALSPLAGLAADRFGNAKVILVGITGLLLACAVAGTAGNHHVQLAAGLLLLGLGWSGTMVAGSAMLTAAVGVAERPAVQGLSDLVMGSFGAIAGAASGFIVDASSYSVLTLSAALLALPIGVLVMRTDKRKGIA